MVSASSAMAVFLYPLRNGTTRYFELGKRIAVLWELAATHSRVRETRHIIL